MTAGGVSMRYGTAETWDTAANHGPAGADGADRTGAA